MEWNLDGKKFRREHRPLIYLLRIGWTGFMFCSALWGIISDLSFLTWGDSPVEVFAICFVIFWFVLVGTFVSIGLSGLCTVHISRNGVKMKFVGIPIRDLNVTEVKTVVKVYIRDSARLVLLTQSAEELRDLSRSFAEKRKAHLSSENGNKKHWECRSTPNVEQTRCN